MTVSWAYIFEQPGADPVSDRKVIDSGGQRTFLVPVPEASIAPHTASALVDEGVALIELCGGFSLIAAAEVVAAVGNRVPVGHVTFAVDSVRGAAEYGDRFASQPADVAT